MDFKNKDILKVYKDYHYRYWTISYNFSKKLFYLNKKKKFSKSRTIFKFNLHAFGRLNL